MKSRPYAVIVFVALLILGVVRIAVAQDIVAGVKPGDEFTYNVSGSYSPSAPSGEIPEEVRSAMVTNYFYLRIETVTVTDTGPEIGYSWRWYFTNGSNPQSGNGTLNIQTTENTGIFWAIYPANLKAGERVHPFYGPDRSYFNETVKYLYTNYTRETNRMQIESQLRHNVTQAVKTVQTETYFDKQTGILVKLVEQSNYQNPTFSTTITWVLRDQNVWTFSSEGSFPPEPFLSLPVIVAIITVVGVTVAIGGIVMSNKRKNSRRKRLLRKK